MREHFPPFGFPHRSRAPTAEATETQVRRLRWRVLKDSRDLISSRIVTPANAGVHHWGLAVHY